MNGDPLWFAQVAVAALADIAFACALGAVLMNAWLSKREGVCARFARALRLGAGAARGYRRRAAARARESRVALAAGGIDERRACLGGRLMPLWTVLTATHAGIGWAIALAGSVLLVLRVRVGGADGRRRLALAALGAIVAAAGKASVGHAADAGAFSFAEIVQTVHLLATGVWGGVVIAGAFAVLPALGTSLARAFLIRIAGRCRRWRWSRWRSSSRRAYSTRCADSAARRAAGSKRLGARADREGACWSRRRCCSAR